MSLNYLKYIEVILCHSLVLQKKIKRLILIKKVLEINFHWDNVYQMTAVIAVFSWVYTTSRL